MWKGASGKVGSGGESEWEQVKSSRWVRAVGWMKVGEKQQLDGGRRMGVVGGEQVNGSRLEKDSFGCRWMRWCVPGGERMVQFSGTWVAG